MALFAWDMPSPAALRATGFRVFPWWHVFPRSIDNLPPTNDYYHNQFNHVPGDGAKPWGPYFTDRPAGRAPLAGSDWETQDAKFWLRQVQAMGGDGFAHNIISVSAGSQYTRYLDTNLEAARQMEAAGEGRMEILLTIDALITGQVDEQPLADFLRVRASHANVARHPNGKLLIGAFAPDINGQKQAFVGQTAKQRWASIIAKIGAGTAGVFFIPQYLNQGFATDATWSDGAGVFGGNIYSTRAGIAAAGTTVKGQARAWMPSMWNQDVRQKEHLTRECGGSELYRLNWADAIAARHSTLCNIASILTWNDYTEGQIAPSEPGYGIQDAFYNLSAYFSVWFKTGIAPSIVRDQLYYFHRYEHTGGWAANGTGTGALATSPYVKDPSTAPADAWQNIIELVAFLASPGRIRITTGGTSTFADVGAGVQRLSVPWVGNVTPVFTLERNGATLVTLQSAFPTRTQSPYQDLEYKGGSSVPISSGTGGVLQSSIHIVASLAGGSRRAATVGVSAAVGLSAVGRSIGNGIVASGLSLQTTPTGRATAAAQASATASVRTTLIGTFTEPPPSGSAETTIGVGASIAGASIAAGVLAASIQASVAGQGRANVAGAVAVGAGLQFTGTGADVYPATVSIALGLGINAVGEQANIAAGVFAGTAGMAVDVAGLTVGTGTILGGVSADISMRVAMVSESLASPPITLDPKFVATIRAESWTVSVRKEDWMATVAAASIYAWGAKDPDETSQRQLNWTTWLRGDRITFSNWTIIRPDSSLIVQEQQFSNTATTVLLAGGRADRTYYLTNHIRTASGRIEDATVSIRITPS